MKEGEGDYNVESLLFQIKKIEGPINIGHTGKFAAFKVPPTSSPSPSLYKYSLFKKHYYLFILRNMT